MLIEILAKIEGNFKIESVVELKTNPYVIVIFYDTTSSEYFISIKKKMHDFLRYLPKAEEEIEGVINIIFPSDEHFEDVIQIMQHIEAFGALDVHIDKIHWETPTVKWIPEKEEEEHLTPILSYTRTAEYQSTPRLLSQNWLSNVVLHRRQLNELYIPFAFFREGANLYHQHRYQSSFCSFYMMIEYFFHDLKKGYGIKTNSHLINAAFNTALKRTLDLFHSDKIHYQWIDNELKKSGKSFDQEGLIFLLNKFRDNFSHAAKKDKNRNILQEKNYSSLAFLSMTVCVQVSIKMRLLPFVKIEERDAFLNKI